jgi:hypothetical protein
MQSGHSNGTVPASRQTGHSGKAVKPGIKAQDSLNSMLLHDRQMYCIASGHLPVPHDYLFRAFRCSPINGQHLIGNAKQSVERRLDGIAAVYGDVAMQDFLQDLGIGNQALSVADEIFEQSLRVGLVRMRRAHEIHWDI